MLSQKRNFFDVINDVYHLQNGHHLVQVFMEDFAIALILSRFIAALGHKHTIWILVLVGILFSASHLPNNLENGIQLMPAITNIILDAC